MATEYQTPTNEPKNSHSPIIGERGRLRVGDNADEIRVGGMMREIGRRATKLIMASPLPNVVGELVGGKTKTNLRIESSKARSGIGEKYADNFPRGETKDFQSRLTAQSSDVWNRMAQENFPFPENYLHYLAELPGEAQLDYLSHMIDTVQNIDDMARAGEGNRKVGLVLADFLQIYVQVAPEGAMKLLNAMAEKGTRNQGFDPRYINEIIGCMSGAQRVQIFAKLREWANGRRIRPGDLQKDPVTLLLNYFSGRMGVYDGGGFHYMKANMGVEIAEKERLIYSDQMADGGELLRIRNES